MLLCVYSLNSVKIYIIVIIIFCVKFVHWKKYAGKNNENLGKFNNIFVTPELTKKLSFYIINIVKSTILIILTTLPINKTNTLLNLHEPCC